MKVENPRSNNDVPVTPAQADSLRQARDARGRTGTDGVRLSGDVRLAQEAVRAASLQESVRPDAVARGRALLESGSLGTDVDRLATLMIDSLLESHDTTT
jgi:hypothetical protein